MITVLLVDDDDEWRGLITRALPGYHVKGAESYAQALSLLRSDTPYDVAIVDLNLIGGRFDQLGKELLDELRNDYPSIPRIALTGHYLGSVRELMDRYDLADLLLKNDMTL